VRAGEQKKKQPKAEARPRPAATWVKAAYARMRPHATRVLAIWALALVAYSNSFQGGLVFDNAVVIGRDVRIREVTAANLGLILTQDYWFGVTDARLYRPLTTLSYMFNYAVLGSGPNPAPYHWFNFAVHAVNIALVYLLGLVLLGEVPLAFAAAAIWALHPVLTESVTNIVGRADLLAAVGILAGLLCHIQAAAAVGRRRTAWLAALALAATIAIFSKESGVVLLAAMAIYDFIFRSGPTWRARIAGYVAAGLPVLIFLVARARVLANIVADPIAFTDNPLADADFWTARLTAIKVLGEYIGLVAWPLRLSADYSYNQVPLSGWSDWKWLVSLAVCAGAAIAAVVCWRRARPVSYFIAFFFAALGPTANLVFPIGTMMAERFLYLPAIAVAGCAVLAWCWAAGRWTRLQPLGRVLLVLVCAALAMRTWARNSDWADNASLWSSAVGAAPNSYKTHYNLSFFANGVSQSREVAMAEADRSLAILDHLPDERNVAGPYANAAYRFQLEGDAATSPGQKTAWFQKALGLLDRGRRIDQARSRLLGRAFGTAGVYIEFGRIYQRLSRPREALEALEFGRRVAQSDEICEALANIYRENGEFERAAVTYMEALALNPNRTSIAGKLVEVYGRMDPRGCSVANGGPNLDCPLVRQHVCSAAGNVVHMYRNTHSEPKAERVQSQAIRDFGCPADLFRPGAS
jgi:tetratricopeptide (TPR) repeat protein